MKTQKRILYIFMFLPLIVTLIALLFLPDKIPAHYGADNQVTRWGSKYETLIFPAVTILMGLFMLGIAKYSAKQEKDGNNNEKVMIITGIMTLLLFNAMTFYFLYTDFNQVENLNTVSIDIFQVTFLMLGIFMVIVGNIMPKVRMNSLIGLRTPWSRKNEMTWKKSQRFGGITFMIAGVIIIVACLLTKGFDCIVWVMGTLLVSVIIDVYYTYQIAKKY